MTVDMMNHAFLPFQKHNRTPTQPQPSGVRERYKKSRTSPGKVLAIVLTIAVMLTVKGLAVGGSAQLNKRIYIRMLIQAGI